MFTDGKKDEGTIVATEKQEEEEQPVVLRLTSKSYEPKTPNSFPVSTSGTKYQGMMMEMIANRDPQPLQNQALDASDKSMESEEAEVRDDDDADKKKKKKTTSNLVTSFSSSVESLMSIYSGAGEVHYGKVLVSGEVELNCRYDDKEERLDVEVVQCRDLGIVDFAKKTSNPYVKCYLLPEKKRQSKRKSTIKKHTLNPVFNATFQWRINRESMPLHSVYLMIWHSGRYGKNDFLGEIVIPLLDEQLQQLNTTQWLPLKPRSTSRPSNLLYYGDIVLSLKFVSRDSLQMKQLSTKSKGELQVLIKHAKNLSTDKSSKLNGCFCKAMLLQDNIRGAKQKSAKVEAKNNNPQWNHTFVFSDVTRSHLLESSLELTFWDREHSSSDFLGGVRLNAGTGIVSGKRVEWMDAKGEEVLLWQAMLDRPDTWIDGTLMLRSNMVSRK